MNRMFGLGADPNAGVPDASTTVKGIVRLATNTEALEPDDALNNVAITPENISVFLMSGWVQAFEPWIYVSADAPTFVIKIPEALAEAAIQKVGTKLWLQQGGNKYFIVTQFDETPVGGYHLVTINGGTDHVLTSATITAAFFSHDYAPLGFPLIDRSKWDLEINTSDSPTKASPTGANWYGGALLTPTGPSIVIPIGAWEVSYKITADYSTNLAAVANIGLRMTLSNANNTESDADFTTGTTVTLPISATAVQRATYSASKLLVLTSKTTYYVNMFSGLVTGTSPSFIMNSGAVFQNIIRARCAYL